LRGALDMTLAQVCSLVSLLMGFDPLIRLHEEIWLIISLL
jgi:hypothetical protein